MKLRMYRAGVRRHRQRGQGRAGKTGQRGHSDTGRKVRAGQVKASEGWRPRQRGQDGDGGSDRGIRMGMGGHRHL